MSTSGKRQNPVGLPHGHSGTATATGHNNTSHHGGGASAPSGATAKLTVHWKRCLLCSNKTFRSPRQFVGHLRDFHCTKEGGSFVCRYGPNGICPSLPLDGVSDKDYEDHVARDHVATQTGGIGMTSSTGIPEGNAVNTYYQ